MGKNQEILCAIEFGTSKIGVMIGSVDSNQNLQVEGFCSIPSINSVVKGEICDMNKATELLEKAINQADPDNLLSQCQEIVVLVTGSNITAKIESITTIVKNPQRIIDSIILQEAHDNINFLHRQHEDRKIISFIDLYHEVEGRRLRNALNQHCSQFTSYFYAIYGSENRLKNFTQVVKDTDIFEKEDFDIAFSPVASAFGILSPSERDSGVILIDIGAGTTSYLVEEDNLISTIGMIQIGFDHVINDLSIGLSLPFEYCRRILENGDITKAIDNNEEYFEENSNRVGTPRKIPVSSITTIIDCRINEIYDVILKKITSSSETSLTTLKSGGILTGGGAKFNRCKELFQNKFGMDCLVRGPANVQGGEREIQCPRFSALWGGLQIAKTFSTLNSPVKTVWHKKMIDSFSGMIPNSTKAIKQFLKSIRL
jgi:cell division protein FtsA